MMPDDDPNDFAPPDVAPPAVPLRDDLGDLDLGTPAPNFDFPLDDTNDPLLQPGEEMPPELPPPELDVPNVPKEWKVAGHSKDPICEVYIHVDELAVTAFLTLGVWDVDRFDPDVVIRAIEESRVKMSEGERSGVREALANVPASKGNRPAMSLHPFAFGTPPAPGPAGRLEWAIEWYEPRDVPEDAPIDYHERPTSLRNVQAGDKLATIVPPKLGAAGRNLFWESIPPIPGPECRVKAGPKVELRNGNTFFASGDGQVLLRSDFLEVSPILQVKGNVDFKVGNILFTGFVNVQGDVLDGFKVKGTKGILIAGNVGAATLESGGDITVNGGVSGNGKGIVRCGGIFRAKYLNACDVETGGDVVVAGQILNCKVRSFGSVQVARGKIRGGETIAFSGVNCSELGSHMAGRTYVAVGVEYYSEKHRRALREEVNQVRAKITELENIYGPALTDPSKRVGYNEKRHQAVEAKALVHQDLLKQVAQLENEIEILMQTRELRVERAVAFGKQLFAGVEVQIGDLRQSYEEDLRGPSKLVVIEEAEGGMPLDGIPPAEPGPDGEPPPELKKVRRIGQAFR